MSKVLLVTNDFPPTVGGIQSYLRDFVEHLGADEIAVFASTQDAEVARARELEAGLDSEAVIRVPPRGESAARRQRDVGKRLRAAGKAIGPEN